MLIGQIAKLVQLILFTLSLHSRAENIFRREKFSVPISLIPLCVRTRTNAIKEKSRADERCDRLTICYKCRWKSIHALPGNTSKVVIRSWSGCVSLLLPCAARAHTARSALSYLGVQSNWTQPVGQNLLKIGARERFTNNQNCLWWNSDSLAKTFQIWADGIHSKFLLHKN